MGYKENGELIAEIAKHAYQEFGADKEIAKEDVRSYYRLLKKDDENEYFEMITLIKTGNIFKFFDFRYAKTIEEIPDVNLN